MKRKLRKKIRRGFTLIELITIMAILSVLSALTVPYMAKYLDNANNVSSIASAKDAYTAADWGLKLWRTQGSPGNSDNSFKINIETNIIEFFGTQQMTSFTKTSATENTIQVGLSLPTYYSQGWESFISECKTKKFKNFVRVWIGKNSDGTIKDKISGIYYISSDGKHASRIVYVEGTKLGSTTQTTGIYTEILP